MKKIIKSWWRRNIIDVVPKECESMFDEYRSVKKERNG